MFEYISMSNNAIVGSAVPLAPDTSPSFAVATNSSIAHTALQTGKLFMHTRVVYSLPVQTETAIFNYIHAP